MKFPAIFALAALAMAGMAGTARADDGDRQKAELTQRLFAGDLVKGQKNYACFVRRYDVVHLLKHPQQKVSSMKLLLIADIDAEDDKPQYSFRMGVTFRNKPGNFETGGSCGYPDLSDLNGAKLKLGCGVDCDGGGISAEPMADNKSVVVRLEQVAIWNSAKTSEDEERTVLSAGADDAVFRLDRAPLDQCKSLVHDEDERAAMLKTKVRVTRK